MNKPQLRPASELHPSMLKSSTHWCFLALGNAIVASNADIMMLDKNHSAALLIRQGTVDIRIHAGDMCYPCALQQDVSMVLECWPINNGEEEIVEWRGMSLNFDARITSEWGHTYWALFTQMNDETAYETDLREGLHPSPRKSKDGNSIAWVWEANK